VWVLATRSRPDNCRRFIKSWVTTQASTPVYVRLDDNDPYLDELKKLPWPNEFQIQVGPRHGISRAMNEMYEKFPNEPWYGFLADDLHPVTPKWDCLLVEAAGKFDISYPNDGAKNTALPTHPCVGGDLVRAIGWFGFPPCYHYFVDTVWQYLGEHLHNIHRLDSVIVEHLHYSFGKSEKDQVYQESGEKISQDKKAYRAWCKLEGKLLIDRLQRDIY
jgi:hypothetical protein